MLEDGLHGVAGLLAGDSQVLLERPAEAGEHSLGSLVRAQRLLSAA